MRLQIALASLLVLVATPTIVPAATVMVYVEELGEGASPQDPRPVRDGLLGGLFDRGQIVFDSGETKVAMIDWETGESSTLATMAVEGGAEILVIVRSQMRVTRREGGRPLVEVTLSYHVTDLYNQTSPRVASGRLSSSNSGRENETDATAVAQGIGTELAAAVDAACARAAKVRGAR